MWFGWGFFFIPLCMIFGAIAIYYLIFSSRHNCGSHYIHGNSNTSSASRAREILYERYARGEITKEEFIEMKKELER